MYFSFTGPTRKKYEMFIPPGGGGEESETHAAREDTAKIFLVKMLKIIKDRTLCDVEKLRGQNKCSFFLPFAFSKEKHAITLALSFMCERTERPRIIFFFSRFIRGAGVLAISGRR